MTKYDIYDDDIVAHWFDGKLHENELPYQFGKL